MPLARSVILAAALLLAPLAAGAAVLAEANGIRIEDGSVAAPGPAARSAAAYLSVTNEGAADDRLVEVRTGAAAMAMLHVTEVSDGVARMRHLADGVAHVASVQQAVAAGDADSLVRPAHTLKSSSATVGAAALSATARALEMAGRSGSLDSTVTELAERLDVQWGETMASLRAWLAAEG